VRVDTGPTKIYEILTPTVTWTTGPTHARIRVGSTKPDPARNTHPMTILHSRPRAEVTDGAAHAVQERRALTWRDSCR
jgi:hypothetical protein